MGFAFCVPTFNQFDLLEKCVAYAKGGVRMPDHTYVLDNSGTGYVVSSRMFANFDNVTVISAPHNIGVAAAWNLFINMCMKKHTNIVLANDDALLTDPYALTYLMTNPIPGIITGDNSTGNGFSLFRISAAIVRKVGFFDEQFHPAYFEDSDYRYRCKLLDVPIIDDDLVKYEHVGSATPKSFNIAQNAQHVIEFEANKARYIAKWGGLPGHETYVRPYNIPENMRIMYTTASWHVSDDTLKESLPL